MVIDEKDMFLKGLSAFCLLVLLTSPVIHSRPLWEECLDVREKGIVINLKPVQVKCGIPSLVECHKLCHNKTFQSCDSYTYFKPGGYCRMYKTDGEKYHVYNIESDLDAITVQLNADCFDKISNKRFKRSNMMPMPTMKPMPTMGPPGAPPAPTYGVLTTTPGVPGTTGMGVTDSQLITDPATDSTDVNIATDSTISVSYAIDSTTPGVTNVITDFFTDSSPDMAHTTIAGQPNPEPSQPCTGNQPCPLTPSQPQIPTDQPCIPTANQPCPLTTSQPEIPTSQPCIPTANQPCPLTTSQPEIPTSQPCIPTANQPCPITPSQPEIPTDQPYPVTPSQPYQATTTKACIPTANQPCPLTPSQPEIPTEQPSPMPPDQPSPMPPEQPSPIPPDQPYPTPPDQTYPVTPIQPYPITPDQSSPMTPNPPFPLTPYQSYPITQNPQLPLEPGESFPMTPPVPPSQFPLTPGQPDGTTQSPLDTTSCTSNNSAQANLPTLPPSTWLEWSPWGTCSKMCGTGMSVRNRVCSNSAGCEGCLSEMKICNPQSCCTEWSEWTPCTVTCGQGVSKRTKRCIIEDSSLPGGFGTKEISVTQCCTAPKITCSIWSKWTSWGACSVSCAGGQKTRIRKCEPTPDDCTGPGSETTSCNSQACPTWSPWNPWSQCSSTCGGGFQFRSRTCSSDQLCPGDANEKKDCSTVMCPFWSSWGDWSYCSHSCNGGESTKTRTCINDQKFCQGVNASDASCMCPVGPDKVGNSSVKACNEFKCPVPNNWEEWSPCSKPCGGGTQTRDRPCIIDKNYCTPEKMNEKVCMCLDMTNETRSCNAQTCATLGPYGPWSECSVSCGNGTSVRTRVCVTDKAVCQGDKIDTQACRCEGPTTETQDCDKGECYTWSSWSKWSECTVLCGGGSRNRSRSCPLTDSCPGLDELTDICNMIPCPDWSDWSPWSDCTVTCGGGQRTKIRACPIPGACSPGEEYEFDPVTCFPEVCPTWSEWTPWSKCSRTCGQGNRQRSRKCSPVLDGCLGSGDNVEPCFMKTCTLSTEWSQWSPCTQTCGGGMRTRSRVKCPAGPPKCPIEQNTSKCNEKACPLWSVWGEWGQCSKTCGGGQRIRARTCPVVNGCLGQNSEIDNVPCNNFGCSH